MRRQLGMSRQVGAAALVIVALVVTGRLTAPGPIAARPDAPLPEARPAPGQPPAAVLHYGGKLDLNRASTDDLEALPGIGHDRAVTIVRHRARVGGFRSVDDLLDVQGVGPTTLAALRPYLRLGDD